MNNKIWELREAEKVCCFDIDGVLIDGYPQCWLDFIEKKTKKKFKDLYQAKNNLAYDKYKKLKEEYRLSGVKENLTPNIWASQVTADLKEKGWTIIIVTARPAERYPCLARQTYNWLFKNGITYDYIIFGEKHKHVRVVEQFSNLKFAVEDNSYIANQMAKWGYKVYLLNNLYNRNLKLHKNVKRIYSLREITKYEK